MDYSEEGRFNYAGGELSSAWRGLRREDEKGRVI